MPDTFPFARTPLWLVLCRAPSSHLPGRQRSSARALLAKPLHHGNDTAGYSRASRSLARYLRYDMRVPGPYGLFSRRRVILAWASTGPASVGWDAMRGRSGFHSLLPAPPPCVKLSLPALRRKRSHTDQICRPYRYSSSKDSTRTCTRRFFISPLPSPLLRKTVLR